MRAGGSALLAELPEPAGPTGQNLLVQKCHKSLGPERQLGTGDGERRPAH